MKKWLFITILTFSQVPAPCAGKPKSDELLVTDRPDFTESAEAVPAGRVQIEFGYTFDRVGREKLHSLGEVLARVGILEKTELRIGINSYSLSRSPGANLSGFQDASLGFKIKLLEGAAKYGLGIPHIALLGGTTLPLGSDDFGEDEWQSDVKLAAAWDLSERFGLSSNVNFSSLSEDGDRFNQFSGSIAIGYALTEKTGCYLEYYGFVPDTENSSNTNFFNGGFTHLVSENFQLDIRGGIGLNGIEPEYFAGIGAAYLL
jgi:hypothetical protein